MRETTSIWNLEDLTNLVNHCSRTFEEWQIASPELEAVLRLAPDEPAPGMVTLTLWQREDQ